MDDWMQAGKVAAQALAFGKALIVPGAKVVDILDQVEEFIAERGAGCAFPPQIALNEVAAHFCPLADDDLVLSNQVVSLDVGVEVNGAIGDNAVTVDLSGEHADLVQASKDALEAAISVLKPGVSIGAIGKAIQDTILNAGFHPVVNLSGHGLDRYVVHCAPTIPNADNEDPTLLKEGMIFAIEPFATTGKGKIHEVGESTLYSLVQERPVRSPVERKVLQRIKDFKGLPFTTRWFTDLTPAQAKLGLTSLVRQGILKSYPPLVEVAKGLVSQAEHTVMITENGCTILTQP